jgi:drug/metabolite transporter (DMT)-like permease
MQRLIAPARAWYGSIPPGLRGILLLMLSTLGFAGMHATIKQVSTDLHPFEIAFFRNLFGLVALTPFFVRHGLTVFKTQRFPLHALRGTIQVFAMLSFFTAVTITPLATVSALSFTAPLFAAMAVVLFLCEKLYLRRVLALVFGFAGALVILRPGVGQVDAGALMVLFSTAIWACAMLIIKVLSRTDSPVTITAYMGVFLTPLTFVAALFFWKWPAPETWPFLVLLGLLGSAGHVCMAQAFKEADASAVLPFDFLRLIWASLLGWLIFAEVPDLWTWVGGTVIFASGTYVAWREARAGRPVRPAG